jgi:glycosyltransferase involved in cell wall biosynthesis
MRSASIIITNYNYERFLKNAIDSALAQNYPHKEVIVVDDASTDGSLRLIRSYGDRIRPIEIAHGGQAAAFNAGFRASTGEIVCFLDADDILLPQAIEEAAVHFEQADVAKVHWFLSGIDEAGVPTGERIPERDLAEGNLRDEVLARGPGGYVWSPTSGNAWSRWLLERILPMPESEYVTCAETYLSLWAPLLGSIKAIPKVNALYREHGGNNRYAISDQSITRFVEHSRAVLDEYVRAAGVAVDTALWRDAFRWPDRDQALDELESLLHTEERFILVDNGRFGEHFRLRDRAMRLSETFGAAQTADGEHISIDDLEHCRRDGAALLVIAWPAFCWLNADGRLQRYVAERFAPIMSNPRLVVYDLHSVSRASFSRA